MIFNNRNKTKIIDAMTAKIKSHLVTFFDQLEAEDITGNVGINIRFSVDPCETCNKDMNKERENKPARDAKEEEFIEEVCNILALLGLLDSLDAADDIKVEPPHKAKVEENEENEHVCHNQNECKACKNSKQKEFDKPVISRDEVFARVREILKKGNATSVEKTLDKYANIISDMIIIGDGCLIADLKTKTLLAKEYGCSIDNIYRCFKKLSERDFLWKTSKNGEIPKFIVNPSLFNLS